MKFRPVAYLIVLSIFFIYAIPIACSSTASSDYSYFKTHQIIGSPDGGLTDYQVKLTVHRGTGTDGGQDVYLDGRSQSWPNDIKFTNSVDEPLSFWIESQNANVATVWVKLDSIPVSPNTAMVKLYYGKAGDMASSSITKTMIFGDDFNDYKGWSTYTYGPPGMAGVSDGILNISCGSGGTPATEGVKRPVSFAGDHTAWCVKMYASGGEATLYTLTYDPTTDPWHYRSWYRVNTTPDHISIDRNTEGTSGTYLPTTIITDDRANNKAYHLYEIRFDGTDAGFYCDGSRIYGEPSLLHGNLYLALQNCHAGTPTSTYVDYVYIRKYTPREPAHGTWSRETSTSLPAQTGGHAFVKSHTIVGSIDGVLSDYQVKFIVHSGNGTDNGQDVYLDGNSRNWPNDIRFTDQDYSPYPYWIESYDTNKAAIWVKIDSIPASPGTKTIYLLYGKAGGSSASDGAKTFLAFDDFSADRIGTYWEEAYSFNGAWAWLPTHSIENGGYHLATAKAFDGAGYLQLKNALAVPSVSVVRLNFSNFHGRSPPWAHFSVDDGGANNRYFAYSLGYWGGTLGGFNPSSPSDMLTIEWSDGTDNDNVRIYRDDVLQTTRSVIFGTARKPSFGLRTASMETIDAYFTDFYAYKYTANPPAHGIWADGKQALTKVPPAPPGIPARTPLNDYAFVKANRIEGSPDGALTDYQVKFVVHREAGTDGGQDAYLDGKSQSWPHDIRFTNNDNDLLSYWIESSDANAATVWVKIDRIPKAPGYASINLYYGRPDDAGAGDGKATFTYFEDWAAYSAGSSINGQGGWEVRPGGTGDATIRTDGGVNVLSIGSPTADNSVISRAIPVNDGQAFVYKAKKLSGSDILRLEACDGAFTPAGEPVNGYDAAFGGFSQAYTVLRKYVNGSETDMARTPDSVGDTNYHIYEWTWSDNDFSALRDGIRLINGSDGTWTSMDTIALSVDRSNAYCRYILVRNFTINEPAHGIWGAATAVPLPRPPQLLPGYSDIKSNIVRGSPDGALTDFQLKYIIHRSGGVDKGPDVYLNGRSQSWPNDIRFADTNGEVYSYWVESYDADCATIWVKVSSIPAAPGSTTVIMYYGKPDDVSASSGDDTFILFDDFNDNTLDGSKWVKVMGDASADAYERNHELELKSGNIPDVSRPFIRSANTYSGNYTIDVDAKYTRLNTILIATNWDGTLTGQYRRPNYGYECTYISWADNGRYWEIARDAGTNRVNLGQYDQDLNSDFHKISVTQKPRITLQVDGETLLSGARDTTYRSGYIGLGGRENQKSVQTFYDNFRMRSHTDNPPTYGTWTTMNRPDVSDVNRNSQIPQSSPAAGIMGIINSDPILIILIFLAFTALFLIVILALAVAWIMFR